MSRYRVDATGRIVTAEVARRRAAAARRFRSSAAWQRAAAAQIARQPQCVDCGARTQLTADHIMPLVAGGSPTDPRNLATRCHRCNSAKAAS